MSKIQPKQVRKIWHPLNQKSHIVATIAALAVVMFQAYSWSARSVSAQSAQPHPVQGITETLKPSQIL
jgi:hypothetical protein